MKKGLFCGFNGFHQFGAAHGRKTDGLSELSSSWLDNDSKNYSLSWSFNAFSRGKQLVIVGFVKGLAGGEVTFDLPSDIKCVAACKGSCLVLLDDGKLFKVNVESCELTELNFTSVERPPKRSIFGEEKERGHNDAIDLIACGRYMCVAITRSNIVYNVPSKVYVFPRHVRVKELVCGFEHALALTANGDVYSWGNGLRGQLGHPELKVEDEPLLVEALAGVKMMAIAAGGWHSAAISSFGDLYLWGSNVNGQLGIPVYTNIVREGGDSFQRKNPTVYALPQVSELEQCCSENVEETCNVVQVACGARHTFIRNKCGRVHFSGWNEHGQFGMAGEKRKYIDKFANLEILSKSSSIGIICGEWNTVLICDAAND